MAKLDYSVELQGQRPVTGSLEAGEGKLSLVLDLPAGKLGNVTASMKIDLEKDDRIFINGYQTWTYCPEYDLNGKTMAMGRLPKFIINHYGIDRYGDYFFVDYPDKPGLTHGESYCYFRRGDHYRLIASLDERPGYTMISFNSESGLLTLRRDCEGVRCGGEFHAFDLFFAEGTEDEVFDAWFAAMGIKCRATERIAGYSSWYNRYEDINEQSIKTDLEGCVGRLSAGDLFQIDDGWEPGVGDWLEADAKKFPRGMKAAAEEIHEKGFKAGLWMAPFVCRKGSKVYKEHPDWMLHVDGKPWYCGCNWGGFYSLDIDNPEVVDYLRRCFTRVLDDWGYDLLKLDFLYAAAPFGSETETRAGRMTRAMELLRELCGEKLILGCGVPLMPSFGLVDYCRISCDVGLDWDNTWIMRHTNRERVSTRQAIGNSIFRRQLNGRAFLNDPDVFFLREENLKLNAEQKHILATVNSLFGGMLLHSDDMSKYSEAAMAQYKQLLHNRYAENVHVINENGITITYELDGEKHSLKVE